MTAVTHSQFQTSSNEQAFVSEEGALKSFCGLGERWWMQVYDGQFHHFGPKVFDEGLHNPNAKEPGYFANAYNAYEFLQSHLCEPLTVDLYRRINQIACAHFSGKNNNTLLSAEKTGRFRSELMTDMGQEPCCNVSLADFLKYNNPGEFSDKDLAEFVERMKTQSIPSDDPIYQFFYGCMDDLKKELAQFHEIIDPNAARKNCPILGNWVELFYDAEKAVVSICYYVQCWVTGNRIDHEVAVGRLFSWFHEKMAEAHLTIENDEMLKEKKISLIAQLFQYLEWLHPFLDGQGRTDLLLLGKLLSEYGLHPAILEQPFLSTFAPLSAWVDYLKEGMSRWEVERLSLSNQQVLLCN